MKQSSLQIFILVFVLLLKDYSLLAQAPAIQWARCYGGKGSDIAFAITPGANGAYYAIAGSTGSNDGDVTGFHGVPTLSGGNGDAWIVAIDDTGHIKWEKCYGGSGGDVARCLYNTGDGYIFAGTTSSNDGDVSGNHGTIDGWVVKTDPTGGISWQKCIGGTKGDVINSIKKTTDNGYILAGYTNSNDGDVSGLHGSNNDVWVVKLNSSGSIVWQKCLGGTSSDKAYAIVQTSDGGYILAATSSSNDGDVSGNHGQGDFWVVKLDDTGHIQWQRSLGGTQQDDAQSIIQTKDGGYMVVGQSSSNDGDVSGNHGNTDCWVVKLSSTGATSWQKCFGGGLGESFDAVQQTYDSGYVFAGFTYSGDGDVKGIHGLDQYWVVRANNTGKLIWQKCLGGYSNAAYGVMQSIDSGYIIAGATASPDDGDVKGIHDSITVSPTAGDYWIVKLAKDSITTSISTISLENNVSVYPTLTKGIVNIEFTNNIKEAKINLYNISGRCIQQYRYLQNRDSQKLIINIENYSQGTYILEITSTTFINRYKILKQ